MNHFSVALELMAKGMGGIFSAITIIMAAVLLLQKFSDKK